MNIIQCFNIYRNSLLKSSCCISVLNSSASLHNLLFNYLHAIGVHKDTMALHDSHVLILLHSFEMESVVEAKEQLKKGVVQLSLF